MTTFVFVNKSCYRRQEEIAMVRRFLFMNGFAEDADLAKADLAILFTCAFCQSRVADMLEEIGRIRSVIKDECELIVGSCLPETDKAGLENVFSGKTITPTDFTALNRLPGITVKIEELPKRFGKDTAYAPSMTHPSPGPPEPALPLEQDAAGPGSGQSMGVFISSGCLGQCSYCAIRFATGRLRSKPLDVVTRTLSEGLDQGYRRFEIYADSMGDYGLDIGADLGDLFDWMAKSPGGFSVGIHDLHPHAFVKFFGKILSLCQAGRIHYLYVPLQSANPRILKLMNRPCDVKALLEKLLKVRTFDGVFLQTSIIVGFPSETDGEFEETLAFLEAIRFSDVYVHCYSDMPNTESSQLPDKIDKAMMRRRLNRLERAGIHYNDEKARHELEMIPSLG